MYCHETLGGYEILTPRGQYVVDYYTLFMLGVRPHLQRNNNIAQQCNTLFSVTIFYIERCGSFNSIVVLYFIIYFKGVINCVNKHENTSYSLR